jgi:hypothetical protein
MTSHKFNASLLILLYAFMAMVFVVLYIAATAANLTARRLKISISLVAGHDSSACQADAFDSKTTPSAIACPRECVQY